MSWHEETENTTHPLEVRELENYYDELKQYQWTPAPSALYNMV